MHRFGLRGFFRFRDDVLIIASRRESLMDFINDYTCCALPYVVKLEEISMDKIEWLELIIKKVGNKYVTCPRTKVTSLNPFMLSHMSNHSRHTRVSWPKAYLRRRMDLCSCFRDKASQKALIIEKFRSENAPNSVLDTLFRTTVHAASKITDGRRETPYSDWLVMPYHPLLRGLENHLFLWLLRTGVRHQLSQNSRIRIAWRNVLPNILKLTQKLHGGSNGAVRRDSLFLLRRLGAHKFLK